MKYFQLEGSINGDLLTKFMDFCNSYPNDEWTIVINSPGGYTNVACIILDIINNYAEKITLISAYSSSAAFTLFYFAKCKRRMIYGSLGMHHNEYIKEVIITENGTPKYDIDKCHIKNMKALSHNYLSKVMTKKELKKYNNNNEVYFTFKRMKQIFPDVEIIKS